MFGAVAQKTTMSSVAHIDEHIRRGKYHYLNHKEKKKEGKEDNGGGAQRFYRDILLPFVKHDMRGREALEGLLKELMVRHRKVVKLLRVVQHYILSPWSHLCYWLSSLLLNL